MNDKWYYIAGVKSLYTTTWSVAREFGKYWKPRWYTNITSKNPEHYYNFSAQLYSSGGSVIGQCNAGDDYYHHFAYVTQRANNKKTRYGKTFYDFYITQHTSDYSCWASDNRGIAKGWINVPEGTILGIFS